MEEIIDKLEKRKTHLGEWLERFAKARPLAPRVQQDLDRTEWEIEALSHRPDEAVEIPFPTLPDVYDLRNYLLERTLPMLPNYEIDAFPSVSAGISAGSVGTYMYVARVGDLGTTQAEEYSQKYAQSYRQLQEEQSRPEVVRSLLQGLGDPSAVERFDGARKAYSATKFGGGNRTAAAAEMRLVLDGIKGPLWQRARHFPKERMNWATMVERLAKGRVEQQELAAQENSYKSLYSRLSDIMKDREGQSSANLDHVWTQFLEHIYAVLNLVDLGIGDKPRDS